VLCTLEALRTDEKASEPLNVLAPMSEQLKKLTALPFSVGIRRRCAGVTTLSSSLFWYNFQKLFESKF